MSPFCSVDTGGNHLIDMLVLVNVTTVKLCGAPLGTNQLTKFKDRQHKTKLDFCQ